MAEIGPRLRMGDPNSETGVGLSYANGVGQVSHHREQEVIDFRGRRSRLDVPPLHPGNSPPGDGCGRIHDTTNLRTGRA